MRFTHEGHEYRMVFRHDKSRELSAHIGHDIKIVNGGDRGAVVGCRTCAEPRKVLGLYPTVGKKKFSRHTWLSLEVRTLTGSGWYPVMTVRSDVNAKAGDRFNRSDGRQACMIKAFGDVHPGSPAAVRDSFQYKAWKSYFSRRKYQRMLIEAAGL